MPGLKMAKADPEEFDKVMNFVNVMDDFFDSKFFSTEEDWREWDDDNEDKKMLFEIEKELIEDGEGISVWDDHPDNRLILYEFIKRKWRHANFSGSFQRIIMDAEVLIENACDPDLDYLEYKPEIQKAIEEYNEQHGETEVCGDGQ